MLQVAPVGPVKSLQNLEQFNPVIKKKKKSLLCESLDIGICFVGICVLIENT